MVLRKKKKPEEEAPAAAGAKIRRKKKPEEEDESVAGKSLKKKKKNVAEIDGVMWALDDHGNPVKKLRKKKKPGEEDDEDGEETVASSRRKAPQRHKSEGAVSRPKVQAGQKIRRRAQSLGRETEEEEEPRVPQRSMSAPGRARTYVDLKGRTVVIDEGGNKTVFDKNGKKLRKKGEKDAPTKERPKPAAAPAPPPPPPPPPAANKEPEEDFLSGLNKDSDHRGSNMFDSLWGDRDEGDLLSGLGLDDGDGDENAKRAAEANNSLSSKISEVGKQNKELQLQLSVAEEAIENLTEQNKKEKSKNVKAMTEVMQLKADFTEASSELQKLRSKVRDMEQTIEEKNREIATMSQMGGMGSYGMARGFDDVEEKKNEPCATCNEMKTLKVELEEQIDAQRDSYEKDLKQKDERINFLSTQVKSLNEELEMMINGEKGGPANPTMVRLLKEKKETESKYKQEKEVLTIRLEGMQEMIETLEKENADLKKQLRTGGGGGGGGAKDDDDDASLDMNYIAVGAGGKDDGKRKKAGADTKADLNASISDMFSSLMKKK